MLKRSWPRRRPSRVIGMGNSVTSPPFASLPVNSATSLRKNPRGCVSGAMTWLDVPLENRLVDSSGLSFGWSRIFWLQAATSNTATTSHGKATTSRRSRRNIVDLPGAEAPDKLRGADLVEQRIGGVDREEE